MKGSFKNCRYCGRPVGIIEARIYRKILVDAEAVSIIPDPKGETFIRITGSKVRGREAEPGTLKTEYAYRPHRCEADP